MAELWYAVVTDKDGELVSTGTVVAGDLSKDLVAIELPRKPEWSADLWDPLSRNLVPRPSDPPLKDRVEDIMADAKLAALLPLTKEDMRQAIISNLPDDSRYY